MTATDFNRYRFGFIGLGLIGGSIARAIRQYWPEAGIVAYNPSRDTLEEAIRDGVVNAGWCREGAVTASSDGDAISVRPAWAEAASSESADNGGEGFFPGEMFADCDIVFLCAPVQKNAENLERIRPYLKAGAILTDIGSTKRDIHAHVAAAGLGRQFIGGHPMTGSERTRYRNSSAALLENAYYLLTPTDSVPEECVSVFTELIRGIRAIPLRVSCDFHDYAVAGISHVPHVVSASLVNLVKQSDNPDGVMKLIAAGGFRDITRISSSSPVMWQQICLTNGDNIVKLIDDYIRILEDARDKIEGRDSVGIYDFFDSAKKYRDSFDTADSGAANRLWLLYVDIEDRPASLAEVVTLLAVNSISIKNIGITHNREFQEGTLRVEFYSEADLKEAREILTVRNYTVHLPE